MRVDRKRERRDSGPGAGEKQDPLAESPCLGRGTGYSLVSSFIYFHSFNIYGTPTLCLGNR